MSEEGKEVKSKVVYVELVPVAPGKNHASINGKDYILIGGEPVMIRKDHLPFFKHAGIEMKKPAKKK